MPYRYLLPSQLVLLAVMIAITVAVYQESALFAGDFWETAAPYLVALAGIYFASMIIRYVLTMIRNPERRWFQRTIPIWFHMVLAIALWSFADYLRA